MTNEEFRALGHRLVDWAADYRRDLAVRPVGGDFVPGRVRAMLPPVAPEAGGGLEVALAALDTVVLPNMVHWQHPRYFGWFPTGGQEAGVLGELVSAVLGSVGLSWESSPALTEVEEVVTGWCRELFGLPAVYQGVIQDSASTATLVALLAARERASGYAQFGGGLQALERPLVVYYGDSSHSSVEKAALLAGFGRDNLRKIPGGADDAMAPDALAAQIEADIAAGCVPCAIVASSGSTGTLAFDPLEAIAGLAARHGIWFHVDAAMAGAALILPELRARFAGIELADSIVINAHKWLGVPFDCSLYFVREPEALERVMSTNPAYLQSARDSEVRNYRDWGLPLGRRFRALKLWFVLADLGAEGLRAKLRKDLALAEDLAAKVAEAPGWRLVRPLRLQTVCLVHEPAGLTGAALDAHTRRWAASVNASGEAWLSPSQIDGRWFVRVSIGSERTGPDDVARAWAAMQAEAERSAAAG